VFSFIRHRNSRVLSPSDRCGSPPGAALAAQH
jgi:hypothetical protein